MTYDIIIQFIIIYFKKESTSHAIAYVVGLKFKAAQQPFLSIQLVCLPIFTISSEHANILKLEYFYEREAQPKQPCLTHIVLQHM